VQRVPMMPASGRVPRDSCASWGSLCGVCSPNGRARGRTRGSAPQLCTSNHPPCTLHSPEALGPAGLQRGRRIRGLGTSSGRRVVAASRWLRRRSRVVRRGAHDGHGRRVRGAASRREARRGGGGRGHKVAGACGRRRLACLVALAAKADQQGQQDPAADAHAHYGDDLQSGGWTTVAETGHR
jgi:hypothetical protein